MIKKIITLYKPIEGCFLVKTHFLAKGGNPTENGLSKKQNVFAYVF